MPFRMVVIHVLLSVPNPSGSLATSCNSLGILGAVSAIEDTLETQITVDLELSV